MGARILTMSVSGKAAVTCGVCGRDKYVPGTTGTVLCGRMRPDTDGRPELCTGALRPDERKG